MRSSGAEENLHVGNLVNPATFKLRFYNTAWANVSQKHCKKCNQKRRFSRKKNLIDCFTTAPYTKASRLLVGLRKPAHASDPFYNVHSIT